MNHLFHRVAACLLAASALLSNIPSAQAADVTHLRCEYRENPLGIDATRPRLRWVIEDRSQKTEEYGNEVNFLIDIIDYRPSPCHPSPPLKGKNYNFKQTLILLILQRQDTICPVPDFRCQELLSSFRWAAFSKP